MQRKTLLKKHLYESKVDAILVTDPVNIKYLSGFTGSSSFIIISKNRSIFCTDFRYEEQASLEVKGYKILTERGKRSGEIKKICDSYGIRRLGFEENNLRYGFYRKLQGQGLRLKPLSDIVENLRAIKDKKEISLIKKAAKRAEVAFRKLQPFIKQGVTEHLLAGKLEELLRNEGCKRLPFEVIVASGPNSALPHARPSGRRLKKGDLVVFDWGGECNGYFSDTSRTVLLKDGNISRQKEIYITVLEAQERAIRSIKAGISSSVIDASARSYIKDSGYGEYFGHGTGHGVGLAVHEKPVVSWRNKEIIKENMIFTVEPGIYLPGMGGVRIEDMVLVKKNRPEMLTSLPKKLKIIEG